MKLRKGNVVKDVPDNMISIYKNMGWKEEKENKTVPFPTPTTNNDKN